MGLISAAVRFLANSRALDVAVVDANGDQIISFGGSGSGSTIGSSATITPLTPSNTSQVFLIPNPNRKHFIINNNTQKACIGSYAGTTTGAINTFVVGARQVETFYGYSGIVSGLWENNPNGTATVTEVV